LITGRFSHTSLDWSPDGSWISAARRVPDESVQIGLISVKDGSFRVLKSAPASAFGATNSVEVSTRFSPDGRYVAYHRPAADRAQQQDIFVIEIESGREVPAVVHDADDRLLAWSPIGSRLLFTSDRTESVGLWELPFGQGRAQGPARRLKPDFGSVVPLGLTSSGTLYVNKTTSNKDIAIAPVDLDAGRLLAPPSSFTQRFIDGASQAGSWSPDGQLLAVRCSGGCLAIRSTATGEVVRRLATTLAVIRWPNWSPDGRWLYACGIDRAGMEGIFRVDARTGDVSLVFMDDRLGSTLANVSPDGKKIYFNRRPGALIERDLASGAERELYRDSEADIRNGALSPNGRYVIIPRETGQRASFLIIPVDGGAPREVLRFAPPEKVFLASEWTPDSNAVIVLKHTGVRWELWKVPITGEPPRKLDIDPALWAGGIDTQGNLVLRGNSGFTVSRDGRRIAMVIGEDTSEVWAHENFLPAQGR
jgi:Tol biopolymer transport system component